MKDITIGRGIDCDVIVTDDSDNVSRKHLIITFDFFGKMTARDVSRNGTFINDVKMIKGVSFKVSRMDRVKLGNNLILNWNLVKDPYKRVRILILVLAVVFVCGVFGSMWLISNHEKRTINHEVEELMKTVPYSETPDSTLNVPKDTLKMEADRPSPSPESEKQGEGLQSSSSKKNNYSPRKDDYKKEKQNAMKRPREPQNKKNAPMPGREHKVNNGFHLEINHSSEK